jgi:hypothetical protein
MSYATIAEFRDYLDQLPEYGQQRITVTGSPSGGTFTLAYEGVATGTIAPNATATAVQTALRAHAAIGSSGVKVSGPPGDWLAKFQGDLATDAGPLSLGTNSLTGGTSPSVTAAAASDARIQKVLDRATQIIDTVLGVSFSLSDAPGSSIVYGDGTDYLVPPAFVAGSVTAVTAPSGYTVPAYSAIDGVLIVTRDGLIGPLYGAQALTGRLYQPLGGWLPGVPYTVAATFGYSAIPADIVEACLEIAVDLWRFKDAGSIKVVGVEGAGMVSGKGLPATAKTILDARLARAIFPGVW